MKISRKLAILVAIPLLSLILLGLIAAQTLQQVRIGGDAYGRIVERKDLIADVLPPPLFLAEANLAAHRMVALSAFGDPTTAADQIGAVIAELDRLEADYHERLGVWKAKLDPTDPVAEQLLDQVDAAGQDFWQIYRGQYLPAFATARSSTTSAGGELAAEPVTTVIEPVTAALGELNVAYDTHKERVQTLVAMASTDLQLQEQAADDLTREQMMLLAFAGLAIVAIVAAAGSLMARSISGPLRSLTASANDAANHGLPEIVQIVRELPAGAPLPELAPLEVSGSEEIKQLSNSFESLRSTAVTLAAGESQLRQNVSAMFVNLGRRNQNLLNRTLNFISTLEENERDPETLDNLFRLDHLVTRMRRNAESLLVLAGTESARTWSQPVEVGDIVRGALSEIEAYDRVDISSLESVEVRGTAAADVSHMLAELLENATTFSPPSAPVTVIGKFAHDGYLLSITDNGIGMTQKELRDANERLSEASKFDRSPLMVLGLFVVSRLALRHGIQVKLAESPAEGVTAKIKLPLELLEGTTTDEHVPVCDEQSSPLDALAAEAPSDLLGLGGAVASELAGSAATTPSEPVAGPDPVAAPRRGGADPTSDAPAAQERRALVKRTRGAQMPDTGPESQDPAAETVDDRSPEAVRAALASFQGGVEYGRNGDDDHRGGPGVQPLLEQAPPAAELAPAPPAPPPSPVPPAMPAPVEPVEPVEPVPDAPPAPASGDGSPAAVPPARPGLSRRVKGANMFDTGPAGPVGPDGPVTATRSPDEVRSALSSFQLGQTRAANETPRHDDGDHQGDW